MQGLYTSTIGSFPLEDSPENRARCLQDLIDIGVDFPNYPQLQDMGEQFLGDMASQDTGITRQRGAFQLKGRGLRKPERPPGMEPCLWARRYLKERGLERDVRLKTCVTGPFTLASYVKVEERPSLLGTAIADEGLVWGLMEALEGTCAVFAQNAEMVFIDEPILSDIVGRRVLFGYKPEFITEVFDRLVRASGNANVGTHICGRIAPLLAETLLATRLDFLSHEFSGLPKNFDVYSPRKLEEHGKTLAIGCISTRRAVVEDVEAITDFARGCLKYGKTLLFTPDCGFRNLAPEGSRLKGYEIALAKIRNMVKAIQEMRGPPSSPMS